MKLDWNSDYSVVRGAPGIRYQQNGKYFNVKGDSVTPEPAVETEPEDLHWTQLRSRVQAAGGVYQNKEQALEFLRGVDEDLV